MASELSVWRNSWGNCAGVNRNFVDEYEWKYDNCYLPPDEELVIYEIHVGDFSGGVNDPHARGQFQYVTEKIDYLKQLGVNASMCDSNSWFKKIGFLF